MENLRELYDIINSECGDNADCIEVHANLLLDEYIRDEDILMVVTEWERLDFFERAFREHIQKRITEAENWLFESYHSPSNGCIDDVPFSVMYGELPRKNSKKVKHQRMTKTHRWQMSSKQRNKLMKNR